MRLKTSDSGTIVVESVERTQYGPKAVLGGDTYDAKDAIKSLDWEDTHRSWNDRLEAWTIDVDAVDDLKAALAEEGFQFGGIAQDLIDVLKYVKTADEGMWQDQNIRLTVGYESKTSGKEMTKTGIVHAVDSSASKVMFQRDDGTAMRIVGDDLYTSHPQYPYVGSVTYVDVEYEEAEEEELPDDASWEERLEAIDQ